MSVLRCLRHRPAALSGLVLAVALLSSRNSLFAGELLLDYQPITTNRVLRLSLAPNPRTYHTLQWSPDLLSFTNVGMALGANPVWTFTVPLASGSGFFRAQEHDVFSPSDTDGDGIDDRYELQHPSCLDPLEYADASEPSCFTNGMSNYQLYLRELFGGPGVALQFFSREESVFNFGAPTARLEAISPELSVYSALPGSGPPTTDINNVYSREVTTWNFGSPSAPREAISREATIWNFGSPSANVEAVSREVAVYNAFAGSGPPATEINNVYSRELSVFNFGAPTAIWEAISRELTVLNFEDPAQP